MTENGSLKWTRSCGDSSERHQGRGVSPPLTRPWGVPPPEDTCSCWNDVTWAIVIFFRVSCYLHANNGTILFETFYFLWGEKGEKGSREQFLQVKNFLLSIKKESYFYFCPPCCNRTTENLEKYRRKKNSVSSAKKKNLLVSNFEFPPILSFLNTCQIHVYDLYLTIYI